MLTNWAVHSLIYSRSQFILHEFTMYKLYITSIWNKSLFIILKANTILLFLLIIFIIPYKCCSYKVLKTLFDFFPGFGNIILLLPVTISLLTTLSIYKFTLQVDDVWKRKKVLKKRLLAYLFSFNLVFCNFNTTMVPV